MYVYSIGLGKFSPYLFDNKFTFNSVRFFHQVSSFCFALGLIFFQCASTLKHLLPQYTESPIFYAMLQSSFLLHSTMDGIVNI